MNVYEFVYQLGYEMCQSPRKTDIVLQFFNRNNIGGEGRGSSDLVDDVCRIVSKIKHLVNHLEKQALVRLLFEYSWAFKLDSLDKYQLVLMLLQSPPDKKRFQREMDAFLVGDIEYTYEKLELIIGYLEQYVKENRAGDEKLAALLKQLGDTSEYKYDDDSKLPDAVHFQINPVYDGRSVKK
jgi:hypothetical protein